MISSKLDDSGWTIVRCVTLAALILFSVIGWKSLPTYEAALFQVASFVFCLVVMQIIYIVSDDYVECSWRGLKMPLAACGRLGTTAWKDIASISGSWDAQQEELSSITFELANSKRIVLDLVTNKIEPSFLLSALHSYSESKFTPELQNVQHVYRVRSCQQALSALSKRSAKDAAVVEMLKEMAAAGADAQDINAAIFEERLDQTEKQSDEPLD
jgi:hypothetical protein